MANISELSGDEREDRVAALKAKMQAAAKKNVAEDDAAGSTEPSAPAAEAVVEETAVEEAVVVAETDAPEVEEDPQVASEGTSTADAPDEVVAVTADASMNGKPAEDVTEESAVAEDEDPEAAAQATMARREFLTYSWGAAMGLLTAQAGLLSFEFMYPRFREGEFGGSFTVGPESTLPANDQPPIPNTDGKFWLVKTEEDEAKAIYMVCTHLGCLYKWNSSTFRFECPCHGSKFSHDGFYIEGPAPRSLDWFDISVNDRGDVVVDTGKKVVGPPASESPARVIVS